MRLDAGDDGEQGLNLTPLIDVVFLLLIFFLAATTFTNEEVRLDMELPKVESGTSGQPSPPLVVVVAADGTLTVDGRPVLQEGLRQRLAAAAARHADQEVLIRGDTRVHFGAVAAVLDACRLVSLRKVVIAAAPAEANTR